MIFGHGGIFSGTESYSNRDSSTDTIGEVMVATTAVAWLREQGWLW